MPRPIALSDDERFPLIPEDRRGLLRSLRQHPHAPRWNLSCGDRLDAAGLEALRAWNARLLEGPPVWADGERPAAVDAFARDTVPRVPFYRGRSGSGVGLDSVLSFTRADLAREPWSFVPDDQALDALLVYPTSGTTGPAFEVYSHPVTSNAWLPFVQAALARVGVTLEGGPDRVSLACVHAQRGTYTYPSLMSWLGGAGFVKINLHPDEWRAPGDALAFLDALAPEIYAGDPYAFACLAELPLARPPKALISAATALSPGLRAELQARFQAPVLDIYSLTEARMVAVDHGDGHEILSPDIFVEIMDSHEDRLLPAGERGEIVLTGGNNPFLPLLRYRTGDFARLEHHPDRVVLRELEGRAPVCLVDGEGKIVNTIDVSRALAPLALARFQLHQSADRRLTLRYEGAVDPVLVRLGLGPLFPGVDLEILPSLPLPDRAQKVANFVSEVPAPRHDAVFGTFR